MASSQDPDASLVQDTPQVDVEMTITEVTEVRHLHGHGHGHEPANGSGAAHNGLIVDLDREGASADATRTTGRIGNGNGNEADEEDEVEEVPQEREMFVEYGSFALCSPALRLRFRFYAIEVFWRQRDLLTTPSRRTATSSRPSSRSSSARATRTPVSMRTRRSWPRAPPWRPCAPSLRRET